MTAPLGRVHDDARASQRRALAAGIGLAIVVTTYGASRYGQGDHYWAAGMTILLAVVLADALPQLRSLVRIPGLGPLAIIAVLVAAAACVPETDQMAVAALLPFVVFALEVVQRRQVGVEWYALAAASVGWTAMFGATGRQSALAGALFAWWPVLLPVIVHFVRPIRSTVQAWIIASLGAVAAVAMARTGGIADGWAAIIVSVVVAAGVSLAVAYAVVASGVGRPLVPDDASGDPPVAGEPAPATDAG